MTNRIETLHKLLHDCIRTEPLRCNIRMFKFLLGLTASYAYSVNSVAVSRIERWT